VSDSLSAMQQEVARVAALPQVRSAMAWFLSAETQLADWQMGMAKVPSPPFGEKARSEWLLDRFLELDLADVHTDELGNVFGIRPGTESRAVALSAHIDTVFPAGTPLNIRQQGTRLYGPGVSDNGAGLTALLGVAAALQNTRIRHNAPVLFIGNVGEEGEGDLRGMRHIFADPR